MPNEITNARAKRLWKRLAEFYGSRFIEQFGAAPPEPWLELVNDADDEDLKTAILETRRQYLQFPPSLPQFAALIESAEKRRKGKQIDHTRAYWRSGIGCMVKHDMGFNVDRAAFEDVMHENPRLVAAMTELLDELDNAEKLTGNRTDAMWITCERRSRSIAASFSASASAYRRRKVSEGAAA